ncbi:MAG: hypothetical protein AMJ65_18565 [Phycisphaerae bacterium SG8_4]|nr:MAG: hypothetical protein AMJ65_18565 [Phycisphaerae bacterium SG8_4]
MHYKFALLLDVAAIIMTQQELCQQCNQRRNCGQVYERLGKTEGPSVVKKVVLAFLLPLVVADLRLCIACEGDRRAFRSGQVIEAFRIW